MGPDSPPRPSRLRRLHVTAALVLALASPLLLASGCGKKTPAGPGGSGDPTTAPSTLPDDPGGPVGPGPGPMPNPDPVTPAPGGPTPPPPGPGPRPPGAAHARPTPTPKPGGGGGMSLADAETSLYTTLRNFGFDGEQDDMFLQVRRVTRLRPVPPVPWVPELLDRAYATRRPAFEAFLGRSLSMDEYAQMAVARANPAFRARYFVSREFTFPPPPNDPNDNQDDPRRQALHVYKNRKGEPFFVSYDLTGHIVDFDCVVRANLNSYIPIPAELY